MNHIITRARKRGNSREDALLLDREIKSYIIAILLVNSRQRLLNRRVKLLTTAKTPVCFSKKYACLVFMCVCVCVCVRLNITAQFGPDILVMLYHSLALILPRGNNESNKENI